MSRTPLGAGPETAPAAHCAEYPHVAGVGTATPHHRSNVIHMKDSRRIGGTVGGFPAPNPNSLATQEASSADGPAVTHPVMKRLPGMPHYAEKSNAHRVDGRSSDGRR
jgi:hypothetical protein